MTIADILRQRQHNQYLLGTKAETVEDAVRKLGAVQAQDYRGAAWAITQRTESPNGTDIDAALASGALVRTHVLRPTWHIVLPEDIRWMLALTAPRVKAACQYYWRKLAITDDMFRRATSAMQEALSGGRQLTRADLTKVLEQMRIDISEGRSGHFMIHAELDGVLCSGGLHGKQHTYALLDERVPRSAMPSREESLTMLAQRFFAGHGPATVRDFAWWSGLTMTDAAKGIEALKTQLRSTEVEAKTYYWFEEELPASQVPAVHLLPNYDEYVVAYTDRTTLFDAKHMQHLDSRKNPLFNNVVVVNGVIVGTWRPIIKKKGATIETNLFTDLSPAEAALLHESAERYEMFIGGSAATL